jgi:hypothetical protein
VHRLQGKAGAPREDLRLTAATILAAALLLLPPTPARAAGPDKPDLAELRSRERELEERRALAMRKIEERLQNQSIESDDAILERDRVAREYQAELSRLQAQEDDAYRALSGSRRSRHGGAGANPASNPALPRIPSQSIVTYPPKGEAGDPAPAQTTQPVDPEGRQKNVGFGTRELEF